MPTEHQFAYGPSNLSMPEAAMIPVLLYADVTSASVWLCQALGFIERLQGVTLV